MKIKVIGLASNDAAYVAEWVFHHLYCGFDEIEVLVYNSTDRTINVLLKITEVFPQVSVKILSSLESVHTIYRLENCDEELNSFTLKLNIDEFWVSSDLQSSVLKLIKNQVKLGTNKLNVLTVLENTPFSILKQCNHIRSVPRDITINGHGSPTCYILKRNMRSELEYIAALPTNYCEPNVHVTSNCSGYQRPSCHHLRLVFGVNAHENYTDSYYGFLTFTGVKPLLKLARQDVHDKALKAIQNILLYSAQFDDSKKNALFSAFSGIDNKNVKLALSKLDKSIDKERQTLLSRVIGKRPNTTLHI
ncbi:hypothetical protein NQT74_17685 [Alteromonas stellipolaris]|uniref:hypothetical protein n=1 Tax=Alteromonas stellipolaris TaxID=233316 RepID=UPI002118DEB2|nr:hypothetical protein [Alteromonas stellipolaris]MCQ8850416.1 hypothetical protein [Alteromonas stellipolaris]